MLVAPFALDALWNAEQPRRMQLALRWALFGVAALAACCATPYGWDSILASRKILDLGELLHLIYEWMPVDFGYFGPFEACILAAIAGALYCGVRLTAPRIILVLGLLHMALSHVRNVEIFALLAPLVVLTPLASQFAFEPARFARLALPGGRRPGVHCRRLDPGICGHSQVRGASEPGSGRRARRGEAA